MKTILFICTHNACRSQMAEGLANTLLTGWQAKSAGTIPTEVNHFAKTVLNEINIDISQQISKNASEFLDKSFDVVVTVCDNANKVCPVFPNAKKRLHKSFANPVDFKGTDEETLDFFRQLRDEIKIWLVETFK